jgi:hypothetical protein
MGGWAAAVYTEEQQLRLGVTEDGSPLNTAGPGGAHKEQFTVVSDGGQPASSRAGFSSTGYREEFTVYDGGGQAASAPAPAPALAGTTGPAWTRGEIEAPAGEKDMGGWAAAVYTEEQQQRLGVTEDGSPASQPPRYNRVAAAKAKKAAKARQRWKVAGAVAKAVVTLPMAVGIPVTHVPPGAVWADAVNVPVAIAIGGDGQLELTDADKIDLLKRKLAAVPPSVFGTLDTNHDGFLDREELRRGFEAMGEPLTDPELTTIVAMADTDKDGKVSCEEFELLASTLAEVAALKAELGVA